MACKFRCIQNSDSITGISTGVLKSGFQKSLRRREFEDMIWYMEELYLFSVLGKNEKEIKTGNAILTNLVNRIIVMLDEEMVFSEVERYLLVREYIELFKKEKKVKYVKVICEVLYNSKICRRNSYSRSYWFHRLGECEKVPDEICFENFKECFEKGEEECMIWMFKMFYNEEKSDKIVFRRRKDNIYMIWNYLFNLEKVKKNKNIEKVLEWKLNEFFVKERKERFLFLSSCIDICMFYNEKWENIKDYYDSRIEENNSYEINIENRKKIIVKDYIYDMHTREGKRMGKDKKNFREEGCIVINEDEEFLRKEWRDFYMGYTSSPVRESEKKKEKKELKKKKKKEMKLKLKEVIVRDEVKVNIKKRGKKSEVDTSFIENRELLEVEESKIRLCSDIVCGNKVMCFEYEGKIYKEGRKSMNWNKDYYVFDKCKELFGLNCIGMEMRIGKFRIIKRDKSILSYKDNWKVEETEEDVVYAVMNKIGNCNMVIERKKEVVENHRWFKEYCRIGMVRGIFRVSDFNMRNVLIDGNGELVSIDENDILGKRKDIFGLKNRMVLKELKKNENVLMELLNEIWEVDFDMVEEIIKKFGFNSEKIRENWTSLEEDIRKELNF